MTSPLTVSERDLHIALGIVSDARIDNPADGGLPNSLLSELADLIRCDTMSFFGAGLGPHEAPFMQAIPLEDEDDPLHDEIGEREFSALCWDCKYTCYPDSTGDLRSITKPSDFYSARQWRTTSMYCEYFKPSGLEHLIALYLPEGHGMAAPRRSIARMVFFRGPGREFSERERVLLALLRPHLHEAYLDSERGRWGEPRLTNRQWELLRLVAAGHTNTQIARRLGLSEGTVRTHLENIYTRLGVSSRTAAVTHAFPDRALV